MAVPAFAQYAPFIAAASRRFGVPEHLIRGAMALENYGGDPNLPGSSGEVGLMQVMPGTFAELRSRYGLGPDRADPETNILAGTAYLSEQLKRYGGDPVWALAAYNAGPSRADAAAGDFTRLPAVTQEHVRRGVRLGFLDGAALPPATPPAAVALPPTSTTQQGANAMGISIPAPLPPAQTPTPTPPADGAAGMGGNDMWLPMLMALGSGLMQGRNLGDGLAKGGQGILPAIMAQAEWKRQQRRDQLEEQALGMKAADAQAKALQRQQMEAMIASLPPDQQAIARLDPGAFAAARAKNMFDAPAGMRMGPDGPEWLPGYIEGQQSIRAAGRPQVSVQVSGEKKGAEKLYTDAAEGFAGAQVADRAADKNAMLYNQLETALNEFKPGALAEYRLKFGKVLSDLGVPVDSALDQGELAKAIGRRLELVAAGAMKGQGQITENERLILREALPSLTTTMEGNKQIMAMLRRLDSYDKSVAQAYRENARRNGGIVDPVSVAEDLAKLGPALSESDYVLLQGSKRPPAPAGLPPVEQRRVGDVYDTPRGKAKWLGNGWELQR